ncbi:C2 domain-containing protein 2 isoform X1 [Girardinichthys multiradiatus]|uniref:C2 domain-containing protein 2 isoform X1 n=1 Tax=Girardinichthys multiradiatus TaxID=208333 RepID=UPI001FAC2F02|nr:C2 domain-containing protein 2 isoform X1 [Girardinichthys multiradiatus]XP_047235726.1 C2 domain-containing protein 2 isoform X1 [Girardinichthys multiradiatus]
MSHLESSSSYFGLEDPQWLCMVTLFIASLVTLALYFVQYFHPGLIGSRQRAAAAEVKAAEEEAAALLGWALSLKSWKSQWRGAWCRALNEEATKRGCALLLAFEEDGLEASELTVGKVSGFQKSATNKAAVCSVVGERLQFSVSAESTAGADPCKYTACIAPVELQLQLRMQEVQDEIKVSWEVSCLDGKGLHVTPIPTQVNQKDVANSCSPAAIKERLRQLLCATHPSVLLSCRPAQVSERKEAHNKVMSPPKPPRAHDWKLLVKNTQVKLNQEADAAGSMNPLCVLQLDDPPQRFSTSISKNTTNPTWDQPFVFELNGRSKELSVQLLNDGQPPESSLLGQMCVPFDLVKKQPKGQQTFALKTKDIVTGSLTTEFTYLEPSEVRSWQPPTPASKRVEMDRTVMPCGTVVTTITAVKSKPGRPLPLNNTEPALKMVDNKAKLAERRVSEQVSLLGGTVSKALSSSDTELLMLNGTDPVAEAAIRQLHQSAKQKLKSPVKKSTIIISGIAKTPLSQVDELALMAGYAAQMDASMSESSSTQDVTTAIASGTSSLPEGSEPQEGPTGVGRPPEDWESQTEEALDNTSLSMCVSEASCKKSREESSAKQSFCPVE